MKKYASDKSQHGTTITGSVIKGIGISVIVGLLLSAALAAALSNGWVHEAATAPCVFAITLLSVFAGSTSALIRLNNKCAIAAGAVGLACYALLIGSGILFSEKPFRNIASGLLATVTASVLSCLTPVNRKREHRRKRRHSR